MKTFSRYLPLTFSLIIYAALVLLVFLSATKSTGGHFIYVLDDSYIHMAMAKNLALHGHYSINHQDFSSASSSPLWTLIISASFYIFGVKDLLPLIITAVCSFIAIIIADIYLLKNGIRPFIRFLILMIVVLATPLLALTFTGMEHVLQAILTFAVIAISVRLLARDNSDSGTKQKAWLLASAFLMTAVRYEGIFVVFVVAILLLSRKKYIFASAFIFAGLLPILILGFISVSKGWYFFPTSVLLKSTATSKAGLMPVISIIKSFYIQLSENPHLLLLLILNMIYIIRDIAVRKNIWQRDLLLSLIFSSVLVLHLAFASTNWFYRYEAYLVYSGILITVVIFRETAVKIADNYFISGNIILKTALVFAILIGISPLIHRGLESSGRIGKASLNIYEQQYQLANFINLYYKNSSVGMNDIGATNYFTESRIVDIWGLANIDVARARRISEEKTDSAVYSELNKNNADIAFIFESWFSGKNSLSRTWLKSGAWKISENFVCGESEVAFFAKDSSALKTLNYNLKRYSHFLPGSVAENGFYKTNYQ